MKIFSEELVERAVSELHIADLSQATIGDVLLVAQYLEKETGIPFIRMDQGSPGLPANQIGIEAEKAALDRGVGSQYPAAAGVAELKNEASRFVKAFMNVEISPRACVPTTGSVAGSFGSFIACTQRISGKNKVLFIDPGFPIQKSQLRIIGVQWEEFDIYAYRGAALHDKLESMLSTGEIAAIVYSNPNNPAWICLEEEELAIIGELATKYDVIVNDILNDLSPLEPGETNNEYCHEINDYLRKTGIRKPNDVLTDHQTRAIRRQDREIYHIAIEMWNNNHGRLKYNDLPQNLQFHQNNTSFLDRFKVVEGDMPYAHTMLAHISKDGHYYIHPDINQCRSLSVREAARIQSFPDDFYFEGPRTAKFVQIGNAVPPLMAKGIAEAIKNLLSSLEVE